MTDDKSQALQTSELFAEVPQAIRQSILAMAKSRKCICREQLFLIGVWVEFGLHFGVRWFFAPLKKIIDSPLRPIAIPDEERELSLCQLSLHGLKGLCRGLAEDTLGGKISPYRPTHEVMASRIANVLNNSRIYIAQINETFGQSGACHSQSRQHDVYQGKANKDEHAKCVHRPSSRNGSRLTKGRRH